MVRPKRSDGLDPDQLRRLREFQMRVRQAPRRIEAIVPARGPLSGRDADILARLRRASPSLADSMEQALTDMNDHSRLSYLGPAGEVREVLRATVQQLAPDDEVKEQTWYASASNRAASGTRARLSGRVTRFRLGAETRIRSRRSTTWSTDSSGRSGGRRTRQQAERCTRALSATRSGS